MFWCPVAPIEQEPEETVGHLHSAGSSSLGRQGIAAGRETHRYKYGAGYRVDRPGAVKVLGRPNAMGVWPAPLNDVLRP